MVFNGAFRHAYNAARHAFAKQPSALLVPVLSGGIATYHFARPTLCAENHTPTSCTTPAINKNVEVITSPGIKMLMSIIRNKETCQEDFVRAADRLMALLAEEGLARLPAVKPTKVVTACGVYDGVSPPKGSTICCVDIMRSGAILAEAVRRTLPDVKTGKILIQRDEETAEPKLFYHKFPPDLLDLQVLLCDPMLATGGSALMAISELKKMGVKEENILFINLLCAPEALRLFAQKAPKVKIVTTGLDEKLSPKKFIVPGLGDMGDRYYGS